MIENPVEKHSFVFNPEENGGESFMIVTKFFANGDPGGVFPNHELTLQSYGNSASINLFGSAITPHRLRQLADELEKAEQSAIAKTMCS